MTDVIAAVEGEVKKVEAEVVKVVEEVKAEVKKLTQELTAEEKLAIREVENSYLKASMEIQRLSQVTQKAQQDFTKNVENLTKKYLIDPTLYVFNNIELRFDKK